VLALVPDNWNGRWLSRHHVLGGLARYFNVVWVEPSVPWREVIRNGSSSTQSDVAMPPPAGMFVHGPELWLPRFVRPAWLADLTRDTRLRRAHRRLEALGCQKIVLYIWRPESHFALDQLAYDLAVYHVVDEYSFSAVETPISAQEMKLLTRSDEVIVHSPALLDKQGRVNPHTHCVPNGVDFAEYSTPKSEPEDLSGIPHPRIGYTGFVKIQLDWKLIAALAERHSKWSFVFAGAKSVHPEINAIIECLSCRPNIHFLGHKTVQELARYPQHFDCCIMPYVLDGYTKYIYPLKLHQYLAGGRPVVGSRIRSLVEFASVVSLAETVDEWSRAIQDSLAETADSPERRRARQAVAREHDWQRIVYKVARIMADRLGEELPNELPLSSASRRRAS
jgi:glycosyltransferase involved in cell wall biosynthesis